MSSGSSFAKFSSSLSGSCGVTTRRFFGAAFGLLGALRAATFFFWLRRGAGFGRGCGVSGSSSP